MHDECILTQGAQRPASESTSHENAKEQDAADWLEVGPKQRAAVTRHSGDPSETSPISRIFGGTLRSELRVPGNKISVTLEAYQPLQLDIGASDVHSIQDALIGLTRPESLTGAFDSPRGPGSTATKQVFVETLPPMLILHLKRFQYDAYGGTQKIWKRIGYPLELEVPKAIFSASKRATFGVQGAVPRYRLHAVVYHHGKSAAGGHYTVDLLRQDRREWIRVDDTVIRRISANDVAEGGAEDDANVASRVAEQHKMDKNVNSNMYNAFEQADQENSHGQKDWSRVAAAEPRKKFLDSAADSESSVRKDLKVDKVAYILLYEKMT